MPSPQHRTAWLPALTIFFACLAAGGNHPDPDMVEVEVATVGVDTQAGSPVVLLRDPVSGRVLPIWVGLNEAQAIARSLHGIDTPRPMTHDLLATMTQALGGTVESVVVHALRDGVYYGRVVVRANGQNSTRTVDSRPSDAVALALRADARIYVARALFDDAPEIDFMAPEGDEQVAQAIGLTVVSPTSGMRQRFGIARRDGVVVTRATGEAETAGLRRGDLVVEVNGVTPRDPMAFLEAVQSTPRGEAVRIKYWRQGELHEAELIPRPPRRGPVRDV